MSSIKQQTQRFIVRFPGFVDEIITDCIVCKATAGVIRGTESPVQTTCKALWDTGATNSMITDNVIKSLNLKPVTFATVYHAGGQSETAVYNVYIALPNNILIGPLQVIEGQLEGVDVLIGMDIIGTGDFIVTNNPDHTELSYNIPSVLRIE